MFRDRIAAWRRKRLINRIVSRHDRGYGIRARWQLSGKVSRSVELVAVGTVALSSLAGSGWGGGWPDEAQLRSEPARHAACLIKGNINDYGERIYHFPGGEFYDRTWISPSKGERWFLHRGGSPPGGLAPIAAIGLRLALAVPNAAATFALYAGFRCPANACPIQSVSARSLMGLDH